MNRETKYRAWDTTSNKMVYSNLVDDWKLFVNFDGVVGGYEITDGHDADKRIERCGIYDDRFILMQFTGLHDRTGKEIYEGDIINTPSVKSVLVNWNKKYASFCLDKIGWMHTHWFGEAVEPENCEIVSNIHANPALMGANDER